MALKPCPPCGHPISEKAGTCPACGQAPHLTPEELTQRQEAEQARRKVRQKRALRVMIPCVAAAALIVATLFLLPDYQRYQNAKKQMDAGEYLSAIENFDALGDYLGAASLSLQCKAKAINSGIVSDASTANRYATELVSGGYLSGNGVVPGTIIWYREIDELLAIQREQEKSEICIVGGCDRPRIARSYACADHACANLSCPLPAASGELVCVNHLYTICKKTGCHAIAQSRGYCQIHDARYADTESEAPAVSMSKPTNAKENMSVVTENISPANEETLIQQEVESQTTDTTPVQQQEIQPPVQHPENSGQQEPDNSQESTWEPTQTPDSSPSNQERTSRIYNSETGQWEWVAPELPNGSNDTTTENPYKGKKYVRAYNPETGTWDWMWVDK